MNKIQLIELLKLRGITELNGISIATAIAESGGDPTQAEMVKVNEAAMKYYIDKFIVANATAQGQAITIANLQSTIARYQQEGRDSQSKPTIRFSGDGDDD